MMDTFDGPSATQRVPATPTVRQPLAPTGKKDIDPSIAWLVQLESRQKSLRLTVPVNWAGTGALPSSAVLVLELDASIVISTTDSSSSSGVGPAVVIKEPPAWTAEDCAGWVI